jgi:VWFA-related protein
MAAAAFYWMHAATGGFERQSITIRSAVNTVEVYATVFDSKGKYVSGLTHDRFEILDDGTPCPITAFEPTTSKFSCALLLDRTGSMLATMPALKNSVLRFIDSFRDNDSFAVYSFSTSLTSMQDFTQDKKAAKQAVLHTIAQGATALFDSLSEVARGLATRKGKKVLVVFTDGRDNSSYLGAAAVIRRAKILGIPIYTVAQGEALGNHQLMVTLKELSTATAGSSYAVRKPAAVGEVFQDIAGNIQHSYMIAYVAPESGDTRWRSIRVIVKGGKDLQIRAREGYYLR